MEAKIEVLLCILESSLLKAMERRAEMFFMNGLSLIDQVNNTHIKERYGRRQNFDGANEP